MRPDLIRRLLFFCAVAAVALLLPAAAADPIIEVIPSSHDFGEVDVGSSATAALLVTNFNGHDLVIDAIGFRTGSSTDFTLLGIPVLPRIVNPMGVLELEVTCAPSAEGDAAAVLEVASNDPARPVLTVEFSGTGMATTPPTVEDVLAEFDEWVAEGTLVGSGPGGSAEGRLGALRNMIAQAGTYLDQGEVALAVAQLEAVQARCDGDSPPPDFVAGAAAAELHGMVEELIAALQV